ncbi:MULTISPECIES: hypothetical protein [unclassified Streptomyces]|uniref:hypothetical protein n=1 Tax=unclassified Streptomyces TaxID=2593676 RepID=UPI00344E93C1
MCDNPSSLPAAGVFVADTDGKTVRLGEVFRTQNDPPKMTLKVEAPPEKLL